MNVEQPETLVMMESIVYKSNGFAMYSNPGRSRKVFTPPKPSPYQGEGVRNSQMI
ncbi:MULTISPECIES: hypothetical protein [unclassified Microcoleus]|uniref:hypothetical protein n=1 Tax=unclassified Microcoleus TaxID=2642155 RepID=UPI002FD2DFBD